VRRRFEFDADRLDNAPETVTGRAVGEPFQPERLNLVFIVSAYVNVTESPAFSPSAVPPDLSVVATLLAVGPCVVDRYTQWHPRRGVLLATPSVARALSWKAPSVGVFVCHAQLHGAAFAEQAVLQVPVEPLKRYWQATVFTPTPASVGAESGASVTVTSRSAPGLVIVKALDSSVSRAVLASGVAGAPSRFPVTSTAIV
jgi:hypothetical protein